MEMKLSDRMNKGLLLVPVLMFLGLTVYEGIVFLLQILLETFGNEMQQIRWESFFLDRGVTSAVFALLSCSLPCSGSLLFHGKNIFHGNNVLPGVPGICFFPC